MKGFVDLTGERHGRWTIVEYAGKKKRYDGRNNYTWRCRCDCGNEKVLTTHLFHITNSCGCLTKENVHKALYKGNSKRIYGIWYKMNDRCYNEKGMWYHNYGGRGITVCKEWQEYEGFLRFQEWALNNGYQEGLTLERVDNDGNYCPDNCTWATRKQQSNNQRTNKRLTMDGETKTLAMWCEEYDAEYTRTLYRIKHGYTLKEALTMKPYEKREEKV